MQLADTNLGFLGLTNNTEVQKCTNHRLLCCKCCQVKVPVWSLEVLVLRPVSKHFLVPILNLGNKRAQMTHGGPDYGPFVVVYVTWGVELPRFRPGAPF